MKTSPGSSPLSLGVVSFLNSRPLIEGLDAVPGLTLHFAVPAMLADMLLRGAVDAALIPVIDLARHSDRWQIVSDACISSDGETLTVRVFSKVPPDQITRLCVDEDSHTSVVLARLLWGRLFGRRIELVPLGRTRPAAECDSVLLIGDKVVTAPLEGYPWQIDLGEMWKNWTGLPFVFAAWAAPVGHDNRRIAQLLSEARDRGVARAAAIAAEYAPAAGWPVPLAETYLTRHLTYTITPSAQDGLKRFLELAADEGIISRPWELVG